MVYPEKQSTPTLHKVLGVAFGISIVVGGPIGAGILRVPSTIAALLPSKPLILACWLLTGGYILLAANSYAELTTMLPQAGGAFHYIKRAFGPYLGFVAGWFDFICNALAPAIFALIPGEYSAQFFPALKPYEKAVAVGFLTVLMLMLMLLNLPGVKNSSIIQQLTTGLKIGLLLLLVVGCFWATPVAEATGTAAPVLAKSLAGWALVVAFFKALLLIMGTFDGWTSVSFFAAEDDNPGRNVSRSYFTGLLNITGLYVLVNAALLHVLPLA